MFNLIFCYQKAQGKFMLIGT